MKQPKDTPGGKWKTIRVRRKTLDLLHDAIRANPCPESFVPYLDVETVNDSQVFDIAGILAVRQITGQLFKELRTELEGMMKLAQQNGAVQVAAHFGATVRPEADGSFSIVRPDDQDIPLLRLPEPKFPAAMMIH